MIVQQADKVVSANNSCRFLLTSDVLPQLSHLNMKKLYLLLLCCSAKFTLSIKTFDLQNCTTASPCCISSDMTSNYLGSLTNSFCKIEYPVRVTENWDKMLAAKLDVAAKAEWEKLTKNDGCGSEACKVIASCLNSLTVTLRLIVTPGIHLRQLVSEVLLSQRVSAGEDPRNVGLLLLMGLEGVVSFRDMPRNLQRLSQFLCQGQKHGMFG
mmetsp:Transcript_47826/g.150012  ORF Transcript_47826/g.150012 Transcript_47826/m.150012 type:complete len:211 (-) Transcript_47826:296-928(-)